MLPPGPSVRAPSSPERVGGVAAGPVEMAKRLEAMGYRPSVATRIARTQPALARRILTTPRDERAERRVVRSKDGYDFMNHGPEDGRPVTLYRGVAREPGRVDLRFTDTRIPGVLFCSEQVTEPYRYAHGANARGREEALSSGHRFGTVMELQVPAFVVRSYGHPVLLTDEVPDLAPFLVRTAPVDLSQAPGVVFSPEQLRWTLAG